jgi:hypothetical protein
VARTTTELAVSDDERVDVLAAFDKALRLEAQVLHDRREIFRQQMDNRLQLEVKVAAQKAVSTERRES